MGVYFSFLNTRTAWPGYGKRADAKYGALLGSSTFIVIR